IPQVKADIEAAIQRYQKLSGDTGPTRSAGEEVVGERKETTSGEGTTAAEFKVSGHAPNYLRAVFIALLPVLLIVGLLSFGIQRLRFNRRVRLIHRLLQPEGEYTVPFIAQNTGMSDQQVQKVMDFLVSSKARARGLRDIGTKQGPNGLLVYFKSKSTHPFRFWGGIKATIIAGIFSAAFLGAGLMLGVNAADLTRIWWPGLLMGLAPGLYLALGTVSFWRTSKYVEAAMLEDELEKYYLAHGLDKQFDMGFARFRSMTKTYQDWIKSLPQEDMQRMKRNARTRAIAWNDGRVEEKAMAALERINPRAALAVRFHETFAHEITGMLAMLPGVRQVWLFFNPKRETRMKQIRVLDQSRSPFYSPGGRALAAPELKALPVADRVDLRLLPPGTLLYFEAQGRSWTYTLRVEANQQVSVWLGGNRGRILVPAERLGNMRFLEHETRTDPGILETGVWASWIYFIRKPRQEDAPLQRAEGDFGLRTGRMRLKLPEKMGPVPANAFRLAETGAEQGAAAAGSTQDGTGASEGVVRAMPDVIREILRLGHLLPASAGKPLSGIASLPQRLLYYGTRSLLFVSDRSTSGNVNMRLPLRAIATVLLAPLFLLQLAAALFAGKSRQAEPVFIDDDNEKFEQLKSKLLLPTNKLADTNNIKRVRFRPLSEKGGFFKRLLRGRLLGAYEEEADRADHRTWVNIYVPDALLRTMTEDMPVADGTLRSALAVWIYQIRAFLFGVTGGYQAQHYYADGRWDSLAQVFGLRTMAAPELDRQLTQKKVADGEMTARAWHQIKRPKVGISPTEIMRLARQYLAEANLALGRAPDTVMAQLGQTVQRALNTGALPLLAEVQNAVAQMEGVSPGTQAAVLQAMVRETEGFAGEGQELAASSIVSQMLPVEAAPGAESRGLAEDKEVENQEVSVMSLPASYAQQLQALQQAIADLEKAGSATRNLRARLEMLAEVLETAVGQKTGQPAPLAYALGQKLRAETEYLHRTHRESFRLKAIGEGVYNRGYMLQSGKVKTAEINGVPFANTVVYELFEELKVDDKETTPITPADLEQETLPDHVVAVPYTGRRFALLEKPKARGRFMQRLMRLLPTRRMHRLAMDEDPIGYFRAVLARIGGERTHFMEVIRSAEESVRLPVIQAYLRFVKNPTRQAERDFINSLLQILKAEAKAAQTPEQQARFTESVGVFSNLMQEMKALTPARKMGAWLQQAPAHLAGQAVWGAGIFAEPGGMGPMGAFYDILKQPQMPVEPEENALEIQRRRNFLSVQVAA
ncbi:hypothetical protein JW933_03470, partial [candidate division FCPU426 bacterium]|nr:hypothetical protein [candidate division FCPU426 bacterium]